MGNYLSQTLGEQIVLFPFLMELSKETFPTIRRQTPSFEKNPVYLPFKNFLKSCIYVERNFVSIRQARVI